MAKNGGDYYKKMKNYEKIERYCRKKYKAKHIADVIEINTNERELYRVEMILEEPSIHTACKYIPIAEIEGSDC